MTIHYAVAIALLAASIPLAAQEPQRQPARPLRWHSLVETD